MRSSEQGHERRSQDDVCFTRRHDDACSRSRERDRPRTCKSWVNRQRLAVASLEKLDRAHMYKQLSLYDYKLHALDRSGASFCEDAAFPGNVASKSRTPDMLVA